MIIIPDRSQRKFSKQTDTHTHNVTLWLVFFLQYYLMASYSYRGARIQYTLATLNIWWILVCSFALGILWFHFQLFVSWLAYYSSFFIHSFPCLSVCLIQIIVSALICISFAFGLLLTLILLHDYNKTFNEMFG